MLCCSDDPASRSTLPARPARSWRPGRRPGCQCPSRSPADCVCVASWSAEFLLEALASLSTVLVCRTFPSLPVAPHPDRRVGVLGTLLLRPANPQRSLLVLRDWSDVWIPVEPSWQCSRCCHRTTASASPSGLRRSCCARPHRIDRIRLRRRFHRCPGSAPGWSRSCSRDGLLRSTRPARPARSWRPGCMSRRSFTAPRRRTRTGLAAQFCSRRAGTRRRLAYWTTSTPHSSIDCHDESPAAAGLSCRTRSRIRASTQRRTRLGRAPRSGPPSACRSAGGCRTGRAGRSRCRRSARSAPR